MRRRVFGLAALVLVAAGSPSLAADVEYDLGAFSHYVWRGITVVDGPVFQPSVTTSHTSGFAFNVWGNVDLNDVNGSKGELNEIDLTLYFERGETIMWSVGFVEYVYPNTFFPDTRELFVSVGSNRLASSEFTVYYDIGEVDDFYAMLAIGYSFEFNEYWTSELGVSAGLAGSDFAFNYSGGNDSGLHDVNATLSVAYSQFPVTVNLLGGYTDTLNEHVLSNQPVGFWVGIQMILSF